jgi:hypothetical protein
MDMFIESVFDEDDPEVAADIERLKAIATDMHSKPEVKAGEAALFKPGVDPVSVVNLLEKYTEGVVLGWNSHLSVDDAMKEVNQCLGMLKVCLCK